MRNYVMKHLATQRDTYQFSWSNDLDLLSNIGKKSTRSFKSMNFSLSLSL